MKKILLCFSLIFSSFFLLSSSVSALTLKDGSALSRSNFKQYIEELGYEYWHDNIGSDYFAIIPPKYPGTEFLIVKSDSLVTQKKISYPNYFSCLDNLCSMSKISFSSSNINFAFTSYQESISAGFDFTNYFSTFYHKAYEDSSYLMEPNFISNVEKKYNVTFNIPKNSNLIVKDLDNITIDPLENNTYSLSPGHYFYSLYKDGYYSKENIDFVVEKDTTIDIELDSKLNITSYNNIYTQYYSYISELVSKIFNLENPLFLFLSSFIIGFSIIIFIKNLLGGR